MNIDSIDPNAMLLAAPLLEGRAKALEYLAFIEDAGIGGEYLLMAKRAVQTWDAALEGAVNASPRCDTSAAAEIMGVSERQARNLAADPGCFVVASQTGPGCRWRFDVRSCYAYRDRREAA